MNIVAIRPNALGDSLVAFPVLVALQIKYPGSSITFVGNPGATPLAKAWRIADAVYDYDEQWEKLQSVKGIRQTNVLNVLRQTDLSIYWSSDSDGLIRKNLLKAGVKEVICPLSISLQTDIPADIDSMHAMEHLARAVGVQVAKPEAIVLPNIGPDEFCPFHPPVAIHPGSSALHRRWPIASFASLIEHLIRLQYPVLLLIGPAEADLVTAIRQHFSMSPRSDMFTVLKNAPMLEVVKRLKQCGCFVGHDTGISHIAGLIRIPTLTLFGSTSPERWRPLGPTVVVIEQQPLSSLPVQRVLDNVLRMYNTHH